jgi:hypothetical protein
MNKETIKLVDEKWEKYFNQTFIESPSKKYSKLLIGEGAIVQK